MLRVSSGAMTRRRIRTVILIGSTIAVLVGVATPIDSHQKMRASVVTRVKDDGFIIVRVTFQRVVWNTQGQVSKSEALNDPQHYQEFFLKLSKAIFLEAHEI